MHVISRATSSNKFRSAVLTALPPNLATGRSSLSAPAASFYSGDLRIASGEDHSHVSGPRGNRKAPERRGPKALRYRADFDFVITPQTCLHICRDVFPNVGPFVSPGLPAMATANHGLYAAIFERPQPHQFKRVALTIPE